MRMGYVLYRALDNILEQIAYLFNKQIAVSLLSGSFPVGIGTG